MGKEILRRSDVTQFAGVSAGGSETTPATGYVPGFTLVPLTSMRRIIAERMGAGSSVPTFVAEIEVDMTGCIQLRSDLNKHSTGIRFAYHDIIASAPPSLPGISSCARRSLLSIRCTVCQCRY